MIWVMGNHNSVVDISIKNRFKSGCPVPRVRFSGDSRSAGTQLVLRRAVTYKLQKSYSGRICSQQVPRECSEATWGKQRLSQLEPVYGHSIARSICAYGSPVGDEDNTDITAGAMSSTRMGRPSHHEANKGEFHARNLSIKTADAKLARTGFGPNQAACDWRTSS